MTKVAHDGRRVVHRNNLPALSVVIEERRTMFRGRAMYRAKLQDDEAGFWMDMGPRTRWTRSLDRAERWGHRMLDAQEPKPVPQPRPLLPRPAPPTVNLRMK